jgi:acyl-CoA reductase-like NAD-dependent aldehyde dehydrogenase
MYPLVSSCTSHPSPCDKLIGSNNQWSASSDGKTFDTKNPFNDQSLLSFSHATKEDVDWAVKAARKAFQTTWGNNIHATERAACESILGARYRADG